jgi:hypothetical protein
MRRLTRLSTVLASAAVLLCASTASAQLPSVTAALDECRTSGVALERYATFRGEMEATPRTDRMAMRFDVLAREPGDERFTRVEAPGLGTWIKSGSNVGRFIYRKQVANLGGPAEYRSRLVFRWYDVDGRVLDQTARRTATCRQPDQRPNLELGALTTAAGPQPDLVRYSVPVRNAGRGDAGSFDVGLRIGADDRPAAIVTGLLSAATQTVTFVGPRCAAGMLRFEVDPDDRVIEADERDNVLLAACPS